MARLLAHQTAVQQSQVRFPIWHPHGGLSALSETCDEENTEGLQRMEMDVCDKVLLYIKNGKINKNIRKNKNKNKDEWWDVRTVCWCINKEEWWGV
jgi:hypothetical protein